MAGSKYEYVRLFEAHDVCPFHTWPVVRLDGRNFHRFAEAHCFSKPNDRSALDLMTRAAREVMHEIKAITMAYGQSDEYSFVLARDTKLHGRRATKILTTIVSLYTARYIFHWPEFFKTPMKHPPSFDGRLISYPTDQTLVDYVCWRQADCHVNNLYNTTFWALVQQANMSRRDAQKRLLGTLSADKNEILWKQFKINYNNEPELFKKGSFLHRGSDKESLSEALNIDLIKGGKEKNPFWAEHRFLLKPGDDDIRPRHVKNIVKQRPCEDEAENVDDARNGTSKDEVDEDDVILTNLK